MTILTAIPCFGVGPDLIERAVKHALAQSITDHVVLVVGDGCQPPVRFVHERLVVGAFREHHGAPFVQQAMLLGSPFPYYAPMGADDYTDRLHLQTLQRASGGRNAGSGRIFVHKNGRAVVAQSRRTWVEFGLFRTRDLIAVGGYNAAEPCGQDSVLYPILERAIGVRLTRVPTYHKCVRPDSLTQSPETRQGSAVRLGVRARNHEVLAAVQALGWRNLAGIRAYRDSLLPPPLRRELEDASADVARWLAAG